MFKNTLFSLFLITLAVSFSACDDNSSAPSNSEDQNYSSGQEPASNTSSASSEKTESSSSEQTSTTSSSATTQPDQPNSSSSNASFDNPNGELIVCKGLYSNLAIQNTIYPESYHCEDGNSCGKSYAAACTETECQSVIMYTCSDGSFMNEEKFSKRYTIETCEGGQCKVYCYNNEIVLDDGDTLKVINCDNGVTYLRDGAFDRKKAGKSVPDTLEDKPSIGSYFAVNCDYGEKICVAKTEEGRCFMTTDTIECPRKE